MVHVALTMDLNRASSWGI